MIGIIGGGASGMAAALAAALCGAEVTLFEKQPRVGKKLSATGNGRCNLTNLNASPERYYSSSPELMAEIINSSSPEEVLSFFFSLGLWTFACTEGRVYPKSNLATSVLDSLRLGLDELGVCTLTDSSCEKVRKTASGFELILGNGQHFSCQKLIIACGGPASPRLGGTSSGFGLLKSLGHRIVAVSPVLTSIDTPKELGLIKPLKGIRVRADISALENGLPLKKESGEILFTDKGVSGIAAMQLSTAVSRSKGSAELSIDLFPDIELSELKEFLENRIYTLPPRDMSSWFLGLLHRRIGEALLKKAHIPLNACSRDISQRDISKLSSVAKDLRLKCMASVSFDSAQATLGGADLEQFDTATLESKLCRDLFACGEVLDSVGECGGFNLHWAWVTGIKAGRSAAKAK